MRLSQIEDKHPIRAALAQSDQKAGAPHNPTNAFTAATRPLTAVIATTTVFEEYAAPMSPESPRSANCRLRSLERNYRI